MQQIPHEGQERSNSQESFYYPPTKPRRGHYPITIQVRRKNQWDIGEWFTKCVQGTDIDKRYGFLAAVLLLLFCLGAVFEGGNMPLSAQASTGKSLSAATHVIQIVRPHWQGLNPTATLASKAAAAHTSTHTAGSSPASINLILGSQPYVTFTAAYATNHKLGVVSVHTLRGAALTISVTYCGGQHASNVTLRGVFYADSSGNYAWTWKPKAWRVGLATARVTVSIHGQAVSQLDVFRVG